MFIGKNKRRLLNRIECLNSDIHDLREKYYKLQERYVLLLQHLNLKEKETPSKIELVEK